MSKAVLGERIEGRGNLSLDHVIITAPKNGTNAELQQAVSRAAAKTARATGLPRAQGKLGRSEAKILKFLAMREGKAFTKAQIGALTGFAHRGGSFNTYLSRLRTMGLVRAVGRDQIQVADMRAARDALGDEYHSPDQASLEHWLTELGGGAKTIYQVLLQHPDESFPKDALAEQVHMESRGGSFNTYISRLCALGLAERHGQAIRLNHELKGAL
jgi:hypothetical protein